jgi:hypothetical protein
VRGYKERVQEGEGSENIILMYKNGKLRRWDYSKNGRGDKGEWWREWIQPGNIVRIFVSVTMYPQYNIMIIKI